MLSTVSKTAKKGPEQKTGCLLCLQGTEMPKTGGGILGEHFNSVKNITRIKLSKSVLVWITWHVKSQSIPQIRLPRRRF